MSLLWHLDSSNICASLVWVLEMKFRCSSRHETLCVTDRAATAIGCFDRPTPVVGYCDGILLILWSATVTGRFDRAPTVIVCFDRATPVIDYCDRLHWSCGCCDWLLWSCWYCDQIPPFDDAFHNSVGLLFSNIHFIFPRAFRSHRTKRHNNARYSAPPKYRRPVHGSPSANRVETADLRIRIIFNLHQKLFNSILTLILPFFPSLIRKWNLCFISLNLHSLRRPEKKQYSINIHPCVA